MKIAVNSNLTPAPLPPGWEVVKGAELEIAPPATKAVAGKAMATKPGMAKIATASSPAAKTVAAKTIWTGKGLSLGLGLGLGAWGPVLLASTAAGAYVYFKRPDLMKRGKKRLAGWLDLATG